MQKLAFWIAALALASPKPTPPPAPSAPAGPLRVVARRERMDRYLLPALRRAGVDAWLVVTREGAVDPIAFDVAAEHAVARAACLFVDRGGHLERIAILASLGKG